MKKFILGLTLFAVTAEYDASAQCTGSWETSPDYYIAWQEEFNYSSTSDPTFNSRWEVLDQDHGWGTEYFRHEQVSIVNGALRLIAIHDGMTGDDGKWKFYKSGAVSSKDPIDTKINSWDADGFYYGVLEFSARIPSGNIDVADIWPALWTFSSAATEIDIVDGSANGESIVTNLLDWKYAPSQWSPYWTIVNYTPASFTPFVHNVVYPNNAFVEKNGVYYQNTSGVDILAKAHAYEADQEFWNTGQNFSSGFNKFAVSWEPDKVTFYINGRETITITDVETRKKTSRIIMSLQSGYGGTPSGGIGTMIQTDYMDIDYVRLYRPVGHNHTVSPYPAYKSINEYMYTNISADNPGVPSVSQEPNSIVADPTNANVVYYRGTDDKLYKAEKGSSGVWTASAVMPNYSYPHWTKIKGDLVYHGGKIFYKGQGDRLQFFTRTNGTWTHHTIDDNWSSWDHFVSSEPGAISVNSLGNVLYRGWDDKMHMFSWNSSINDWVGTRLSHNYSTNDYIDGDVISGSSQVYYRGANGKIQNFWPSGSTYYHGNIDTQNGNSSHHVKDRASTMTLAPNGQIYYVGIDDKLHKYFWNGGWTHELIDANSGSSLYTAGFTTFSYFEISYAYSTVKVDPSDPTNNTILYVGGDGRIQRVKKAGNNWTHEWIDDYWNTDFHCSYSGFSQANGIASMGVTSDGKILYDQYGKNLSSFEFGSCENLNPQSRHGILKSAHGPLDVPNIQNEDPISISLVPNPASDRVNVTVAEGEIERILIFDMTGRTVKTADQPQGSDISLNGIRAGVYTVMVYLKNGNVSKESLIIE